MELDQYQEASRVTAVYPDLGKNYIYPALGLCGEAGEVAEKIKKIWRDRNNMPNDADFAALEKELGDVLWYVAALATELGFGLNEIAVNNLAKLADRAARNLIHGAGDAR